MPSRIIKPAIKPPNPNKKAPPIAGEITSPLIINATITKGIRISFLTVLKPSKI